jgi:hypothetical protein
VAKLWHKNSANHIQGLGKVHFSRLNLRPNTSGRSDWTGHT